MATVPYILGHAPDELDRLIDQARFFGGLTEEVLRRAGVGPGMRVLDLGCGTGDVSFLAARLVGPTGTVLGVDRSPEAVATATARAGQAGPANVTFAVGDLVDLELTAPVDALVGRFVLMYLDDPAATLRRVLGLLEPGGVVAFQEMDMGAATCEPDCPLYLTPATGSSRPSSGPGSTTAPASSWPGSTATPACPHPGLCRGPGWRAAPTRPSTPGWPRPPAACCP